MKTKPVLSLIGILALQVGLMLMPSTGFSMALGSSIEGTVSYEGSHDTNHNVLVSAHLDPGSGPVTGTTTWGPGGYSIDDLPDGTYYISAFLDIHDRGDGPPEYGEPSGWHDPDEDGVPNPVVVSGGNVSGIDITMTDVTDYIQGTACYLGGAQGVGPIEVSLHTGVGSEPVATYPITALPCDEYIFSSGPAGTYYLSMYYDLNNSSGPPDPGEPITWYDADEDGNPDPIVYTGGALTDVDITLGKERLYVDFNADGANDGTSWEDAFNDLQDALADSDSGDEIWVAAGVYTPGTTREASFEMKEGVAIYGGFNTSETYRHQRNPLANVTVLSGEIGNPVTPTDNVYHVVSALSDGSNTLDDTAILDGFTIMLGYAGVDSGYEEQGGGLLNRNGSPTLVNLRFVNNYALNHGGALANRDNDAPLQVINSTFSGNNTTYNGGAIANISGQINVTNCGLAGNNGANGGGIVSLGFDAQTEVHNSILWDNQGAEIAIYNEGSSTVSYSIIEGGFAGGTNILTSNPLFVNAVGTDGVYGTLDDDLHLQSSSPAIDAGDNARLPADSADSDGDDDTAESTPVDFDGGDRQVDDATMPNTGNGTPPVDIGADEYAPATAVSGLSAVSSATTLLGETSILAARVADGSQIGFTWNFDDGENGVGGAVGYAYAAPGIYKAEVTASNSQGTLQASTTVTVYESMEILPNSSQMTADGVLEVEIPDAAPGAVTLTYTPQTDPSSSPGSFTFAGTSFQLQAEEGDGTPILEPDPPFTMVIHYDESDLPSEVSESTLQLLRYDTGSGQWVALTVLNRDLVNNTLTVSLDHFSEFALVGESTPQGYQVFLPLVLR